MSNTLWQEDEEQQMGSGTRFRQSVPGRGGG